MRLNVGCGARRIDGYTGVDAVNRSAADIVAKADAIPLEDGSVEEILAIHLFEHFYRWECDRVLAEWCRLLMPKGRLTLELPNLTKCCENVLSGRMGNTKHPDQLGMWGLYGDPRQGDEFMTHRWGWTPATLTELLTSVGFIDVHEEPTRWHPIGQAHRDMRIVGRRPK